MGRIKARNDNWVFMDKSKDLYLWKLQWTAIKRHILVKGKASPDNPALKEYCKNVKLVNQSTSLRPDRFFGVDKKVNALFV
ncbi:group II intron encoded reverse transcriptase domain protein [Rickettsia hoogstraalii str. RCCE3]|nr:group II intron encoded reverse transcriptase domain protein [Rickettsia hoogstraalii str. RCCE3]